MAGEARELQLYIENDATLYRQQYQPILKNLATKKARGIYDHAKAVKLFGYLVDNGAKKYAREFSSPSDWNRIFSVADRKKVAEGLTSSFETEYGYGNYDNFLPKKYQKKSNPDGIKIRVIARVKTLKGLEHALRLLRMNGAPLPNQGGRKGSGFWIGYPESNTEAIRKGIAALSGSTRVKIENPSLALPRNKWVNASIMVTSSGEIKAKFSSPALSRVAGRRKNPAGVSETWMNQPDTEANKRKMMKLAKTSNSLKTLYKVYVWAAAWNRGGDVFVGNNGIRYVIHERLKKHGMTDREAFGRFGL